MNDAEKIVVSVQDTTSVWSELSGKPGDVLMRMITGAKMNMEASCDGECACSTCHVYIDEPWLAKLDPPSEDELMMIEYTDKPRENSRLSCQIKLTPQLNGLRAQIIGK